MKKKAFATRLMVTMAFGLIWQKIGAKIAHRIAKGPKEPEEKK